MHPEARTEPVRQAAGAVHAVTHPGSAADGAVCSHSALRSAPAKPGFACWVGCNVLGRGESIHSTFLAVAPCPAHPRERSGRRLRCLMHLPLRWEADRPRERAARERAAARFCESGRDGSHVQVECDKHTGAKIAHLRGQTLDASVFLRLVEQSVARPAPLAACSPPCTAAASDRHAAKP